MTIQSTINRNDIDIDVQITLAYFPGEYGSRDSYGAPLEPDYPATFEVESVVDTNGAEYDLTATEETSVIKQAFSEREAYINDYN
jgi:hypothetical protein